MVFSSEITLEAPSTDVITWAFSRKQEKLEAPALVDVHSPDRVLTRADCLRLIRQAAAGLHAFGVRAGECVAVHAPNDIYVPILGLACCAIGAIIAPTSIGASVDELARCMSVCDASWIFVEPTHVKVIEETAVKAGIPQSQIFLFNHPGSEVEGSPLEKSFASMFAFGERDHISFDDPCKAQSVPVLRCFTSGSSGLPKAVELPHVSLTFSALQRCDYLHIGKDYEVRRLHTTPHHHLSIWLLSLDMFAGFGTLYISKPAKISQICDIISLCKITDSIMPPKAMSELYDVISSGLRPASSLESLKSLTGSGASVQAPIVHKLKSIIGSHLHVSSAYGSTEALGLASLPYPEEPETDPYPLGRNLPGVVFMLRDVENGEEIGEYDTPGEMWVSSPAMYTRYYKNDSANQTAYMRDSEKGMRWYRTGDVGFISRATKQWTLIGRSSEVFKIHRDGKMHRVAPARIETLLMSLTGISDAAIGPSTNDSGHIEVKLWAVLSDKSTLSANDIIDFLQDKVSQYDMPTAGIMFVEQIPRTSFGKIKRLELGKLQGVESM